MPMALITDEIMLAVYIPHAPGNELRSTFFLCSSLIDPLESKYYVIRIALKVTRTCNMMQQQLQILLSSTQNQQILYLAPRSDLEISNCSPKRSRTHEGAGGTDGHHRSHIGRPETTNLDGGRLRWKEVAWRWGGT